MHDELFKKNKIYFLLNDTPSHNFRINFNTLSHNFLSEKDNPSLNFITKGHFSEGHIPTNKVCCASLGFQSVLGLSFY